MTEEKTQNEQKNTVATVGMRFSIIWLIALITVFFIRLWLPLLLVWFILWIIGLFYKPRGKARVAVIIPLVVFITMVSIACYVWSSVKTPANEFMDWVKPQFEQLENDENFDWDRFWNLLKAELDSMTKDKSDEDWEALFKSSTGSNTLEKGAYILSSMFKEWFESALERYNNELPEIDENDENNIDEVVDEDANNEQDETEANEVEVENNETSLQNEENNIEEILNILE